MIFDQVAAQHNDVWAMSLSRMLNQLEQILADAK